MDSHPDNAPQTVRELLLRSFDAVKTRNYGTAVVPIADPGFDRYVLRSDSLHPVFRPRLNTLLTDSSCLTAPHLLFIGPDISQPLLVPHPHVQTQGKTFSIMPKHSGHTLAEYLDTGGTKRKLALMQRWMDQPHPLEHLFAQAAFVGLQKRGRITPDLHPGNIMVDAADVPSLIDIAAPEDAGLFYSNARSPKALREKSLNYIDDLHKNLHMALNTDGEPLSSKDQAVRDRFVRQLDTMRTRTQRGVKNGSLLAAHPEWKGFRYLGGDDPLQSEDIPDTFSELEHIERFRKVHSVAAVALDAPPRALKERLDRLYDAAITR